MQYAVQPNNNEFYCQPLALNNSKKFNTSALSPYGVRPTTNKIFNRGLSTKARYSMTDQEFLEWFAGFVDGEAYFGILRLKSQTSKAVGTVFVIELHIDDVNLLYFIQKRLGVGIVTIRKDNNSAVFKISSSSDLKFLVSKFLEKFPLNGYKYLDYLVFKEILEMKINKQHLSVEGQKKIDGLLKNFNSTRTNFDMPLNHTIRITPYYFLGLTEGEGSFIYNSLKILRFKIGLTAFNLPLLKALKIFIDNIPQNTDKSSARASVRGTADKATPKIDRCKIYLSKQGEALKRQMYELNIEGLYFIYNFFIPFLSKLEFQSKKKLDFEDWKLICQLMALGLHLTPEGNSYITALKSRMNNARLSTNKNNLKFKIIPLPEFDPFKLKPVYEITDEGLFRVISTGRIAVKAKFYKLIEIDSGKISYIEGRKHLANYFEGSDYRVVDKAINNKLILQRKLTGISYTVEKIY
jgi:hypothetical protein